MFKWRRSGDRENLILYLGTVKDNIIVASRGNRDSDFDVSIVESLRDMPSYCNYYTLGLNGIMLFFYREENTAFIIGCHAALSKEKAKNILRNLWQLNYECTAGLRLFGHDSDMDHNKKRLERRMQSFMNINRGVVPPQEDLVMYKDAPGKFLLNRQQVEVYQELPELGEGFSIVPAPMPAFPSPPQILPPGLEGVNGPILTKVVSVTDYSGVQSGSSKEEPLGHQRQTICGVIVEIEKSAYRIVVRNPETETLQSVCETAICRHLERILEIDEHATQLILDSSKIDVGSIECHGTFMGRWDTIEDSQLSSGDVLKVVIRGNVANLKENFSDIFQPPESPGNTEKFPLSGFTVKVKILGNTFKISIKNPSEDTLGTVCEEAVIRFVSQMFQMTKAAAAEFCFEKKISVFSIQEQGASLDLECSVLGNNLSTGVLLLANCYGLEDLKWMDVPSDAPPFGNRMSANVNKILAEKIREATSNFSKENIIGKGGQAVVYKGHLFGSIVAVKQFLSPDDMVEEMAALQKVHHPNLILLMGYCPEEKCIISEFMAGGSLQDYLNSDSGVLTWACRLQIVKEVISAVLFLHSHSVLHQDLKPSNILFNSYGTCKVADLGSARLFFHSTTASSRPITAGYVCPHFIETRRITAKMDVYALGLVGLQLCTHEPDISMIHEKLEYIGRGEKRCSSRGMRVFEPLLVKLDGSLPRGKVLALLEMVLKCAERDPSNRPQSNMVINSLLERSEPCIGIDTMNSMEGASQIDEKFFQKVDWVTLLKGMDDE